MDEDSWIVPINCFGLSSYGGPIDLNWTGNAAESDQNYGENFTVKACERRMFTTAISCYSRFWTNDLNFRLMSEQELINYFIQTGACHYLKYDSVRKLGLSPTQF